MHAYRCGALRHRDEAVYAFNTPLEMQMSPHAGLGAVREKAPFNTPLEMRAAEEALERIRRRRAFNTPLEMREELTATIHNLVKLLSILHWRCGDRVAR